jgi:hypothetical protein
MFGIGSIEGGDRSEQQKMPSSFFEFPWYQVRVLVCTLSLTGVIDLWH